MTQIIAALCNNKNEIVFVSDRMVTTYDDELHYDYEPKLEAITEYAVSLVTGTMHEPEIIDDARAEVAGRQNIRQIADIVAKHYRKQRMTRIETDVLSRYGIVSFDDFYNKQKLMHDNTHRIIMDGIEEYEFDLGIIVAGLNRDLHPHIYSIEEPGTAVSYDNVGYCCEGSGETHADSVFAFYEYNPSMPIEQVLYISYIAKKRAQMATGVGEKTDAWVMSINGCRKIKQETIDMLEKHQIPINLDLLGKIDIQYEDEPETPKE